MLRVSLTVSTAEELDLRLTVDDGLSLNLDGIYVNGHVPAYEGAYEVTPAAWEEQVLATEGLRMERDVTVFEVPYQTAGNESGGMTATIA